MEALILPYYTTKRAVPLASIEYLEAVGNYTNVHLVGQKPVLVALTLKEFNRRLPGFLRIHKSTLVNPAYVVDFHSRREQNPFVRLSQDRLLLISRRQFKQVQLQLDAIRNGQHECA